MSFLMLFLLSGDEFRDFVSMISTSKSRPGPAEIGNNLTMLLRLAENTAINSKQHFAKSVFSFFPQNTIPNITER